MISKSTSFETSRQPEPANETGSGENAVSTARMERITETRFEEKKQTILHGREPEPGQVNVSFSQTALRQVEGHSMADLTRELGGVLLGQARKVRGRNEVDILAALPVSTVDHGPVHFTFTADTWAQLHRDRAEQYPGLDIVGWYHTHPNLGVFFSADDVIVHKAAFVMPWQVGLVIDPVRSEGFLVGWQESDPGKGDAVGTPTLASLNGFYEVLQDTQASAVNWQLVRSSIWHQAGYTGDLVPRRSRVYAPDSDWQLLPPISPWWGVLLGGLSLLISILLLLERLLAG